MAEGGDFGYDDPYHDYEIEHDDDYDVQEPLNTTQPFNPGQASTPYHGGEQMEMQTMMHEQSGMPDTSYAETPLLGDFMPPEEKQRRIDRTIDFIKRKFPKADLKKLGPIGFSKKGAQTDNRFIRTKRWRDSDFKKRWQRASKKLHRQIFKISWAKRGTNYR